MDSVLPAIDTAWGGVVSIDGVTKILAKSNGNVVIRLPLPLLIEYLEADLKHETIKNVVDKIVDVIKRLNEYVGFASVQAFI